MIELQVHSSNFPLGGPDGSRLIQFTKSQLCWATLTVGKRSKSDIRHHAHFSHHECLFRWNMVLSVLDLGGHGSGVCNSSLFDALDPTEKGGINYFLGMIFLKLCAQKLLNIPWLIHLHWMKSNHGLAMLSGKSAPDLLGYDPSAARWAVFEAKGRNAGYSKAILAGAKKQSRRAIKVDGAVCSLHVGSLLYRSSGGPLEFAWEDPSPESEEPIGLESDRDTWLSYYSTMYELVLEQEKDREPFEKTFGFFVEMCKPARDLVQALIDGRDYSNELGLLFRWSADNLKDRQSQWNGDGIAIHVGERLK